MPKWKSESETVEHFENGKLKLGSTIWMPLNDAAKASPQVQTAIDKGKYTPKSPNEREVLKAKLKASSKASLKKRGH